MNVCCLQFVDVLLLVSIDKLPVPLLAALPLTSRPGDWPLDEPVGWQTIRIEFRPLGRLLGMAGRLVGVWRIGIGYIGIVAWQGRRIGLLLGRKLDIRLWLCIIV